MYDDLLLESMAWDAQLGSMAPTPTQQNWLPSSELRGYDAYAEIVDHAQAWRSDFGFAEVSLKDDHPLFTQDPPPDDLGTVVVYGSRHSVLSGWSASSSGFFGGGGSDAGSEPVVFTPDYRCSDMPDGTKPDDRTLERVRLIADQVGDRMKLPDLNKDWEWGSLIYLTNDGYIYSTPPFSIHRFDGVTFPWSDASYLPDGAVILASVHTHVFIEGQASQDRLSDYDANAFESFSAAAAQRSDRFSVSSSLMTYILDKEDNKLWEFDVDDKEGERGVRIGRCG